MAILLEKLYSQFCYQFFYADLPHKGLVINSFIL